MESSAAPPPAQNLATLTPKNLYDPNNKSDSLVIEATLLDAEDEVTVGVDDLTKSLTISAREIVRAINEALGTDLPEGIESLAPADVTPEASSDMVVSGIAAMFDAFAKQNPGLEGEELVEEFMSQARSGVEAGYNEAFSFLRDLGAFEFEGVQDGVAETKALIDQKLNAFEAQKRKELGLEDTSPIEGESALATSQALLAQGGSGVLSVVA